MLAFPFILPASLLAVPQKIQIKTPDGIQLQALYNAPTGAKPVALMLHGLDSSKEEWRPLMSVLETEGWGYLAYDARRSGTPWQKWVDDQGAAIRALEKAGVARSRVFLVGASVGANVSLKYAALTGVGKGLILLSPGMNYQGVTTADAVLKVSAPILIVSSPADGYAADSSAQLKKISPRIELWTDVKPGHGVQMFDDALLVRLMAWLKAKAR